MEASDLSNESSLRKWGHSWSASIAGLLDDATPFADVTFLVGEGKERIKAHKLILGIRSPVFKELFYGRPGPRAASQGSVVVDDVKPKAFRQLLQFLYTGAAPACIYDLLELAVPAKKYEVHDLLDVCKKEVLQEGIFSWYQTSIEKKQQTMAEDLWSLILGLGDEALESEDLLNISHTNLCRLFSSEDLTCSELTIAKAALRWAKHRCQKEKRVVTTASLHSVLKEALTSIRFPLIPVEDFDNFVKGEGINLLLPSELAEMYKYHAIGIPPIGLFSCKKRVADSQDSNMEIINVSQLTIKTESVLETESEDLPRSIDVASAASSSCILTAVKQESVIEEVLTATNSSSNDNPDSNELVDSAPLIKLSQNIFQEDGFCDENETNKNSIPHMLPMCSQVNAAQAQSLSKKSNAKKKRDSTFKSTTAPLSGKVKVLPSQNLLYPRQKYDSKVAVSVPPDFANFKVFVKYNDTLRQLLNPAECASDFVCYVCTGNPGFENYKQFNKHGQKEHISDRRGFKCPNEDCEGNKDHSGPFYAFSRGEIRRHWNFRHSEVVIPVEFAKKTTEQKHNSSQSDGDENETNENCSQHIPPSMCSEVNAEVDENSDELIPYKPKPSIIAEITEQRSQRRKRPGPLIKTPCTPIVKKPRNVAKPLVLLKTKSNLITPKPKLPIKRSRKMDKENLRIARTTELKYLSDSHELTGQDGILKYSSLISTCNGYPKVKTIALLNVDIEECRGKRQQQFGKVILNELKTFRLEIAIQDLKAQELEAVFKKLKIEEYFFFIHLQNVDEQFIKALQKYDIKLSVNGAIVLKVAEEDNSITTAFTEEVQDVVGNCKGILKTLAFGYCKFSSKINNFPSEKLKKLVISNCIFTNISDHVDFLRRCSKLEALKWFDFYGRGLDLERDLACHQKLKTLAIYNAKLKISGVFPKFSKLDTLIISEGNWDVIEGHWINLFPKLKVVCIGGPFSRPSCRLLKELLGLPLLFTIEIWYFDIDATDASTLKTWATTQDKVDEQGLKEEMKDLLISSGIDASTEHFVLTKSTRKGEWIGKKNQESHFEKRMYDLFEKNRFFESFSSFIQLQPIFCM